MNSNSLFNHTIVLLGSGNVSTHLGIALQEKGFSIVQVYSRTLASAKALGDKLQTNYTDNIKEVVADASIYIFSVKDSALPEILKQLPPLSGLLVHTAGSVPIHVFADYTERRGVLYPLQTFSKNRQLLFNNLPFFIEANCLEDEILLEKIASTLSNKVVHLPSKKRKQLHLAAVLACNFTNHLYASAAKVLEEQGLDWDLLLPLIQETAAKVKDLHPKEAQTGPAVRYDENVINMHLEMLKENPHLQELYRLLSQDIHRQG